MFEDFYDMNTCGQPPDGVDTECRCRTCLENPALQKCFCWWCGVCYFKLAQETNTMAEWDVGQGNVGYHSELGTLLWFCSECRKTVFNDGLRLGRDRLSEMIETKVDEKVSSLASVNVRNYESIMESIAVLSQRLDTVSSISSQVDDLVGKVNEIKKSCENTTDGNNFSQTAKVSSCWISPPRKRLSHGVQEVLHPGTLPSLSPPMEVNNAVNISDSTEFNAIVKLTAGNLQENAKVMERLVEEKEKDSLFDLS